MWEMGGWKNGYRSLGSTVNQYQRDWGGYGSTAGSLTLGAVGFWAGAKAGAAIGGLIGSGVGPIGTGIGLAVGAVAGIAGGALGYGVGSYTGRRYAYLKYGMSLADKLKSGAMGQEFATQFVNTRQAATMRQAAMASMMSSSSNYRMVLGREASRFHK